MNAEQQTHEFIELYLADELSAEELTQFEQRCENEPGFKEELELQKAAHKVVEITADLALKNRLRAIETEMNSSSWETAEKRFSSKNMFLRVAAVVLLLFAAVVVFNLLQRPTSQALYSEHFEPYRAPVNVRSQNLQFSEQWKHASQLYRSEDFSSAATAFEEILKNNGQEAKYLVHFYLAMSFLSCEDVDAQRAIPHFNAVFQTDNDYHQQSHWYLALAYLSLENEESACAELEKLVQESNRYKQEEAKEILHELE